MNLCKFHTTSYDSMLKLDNGFCAIATIEHPIRLRALMLVNII